MKWNFLKIGIFIVMLSAFTTALAYDFKIDSLYYNIISKKKQTVEVVQYCESKEDCGDVVIPERVKYDGKIYSVTSIGKEAFAYCESLTKLNIPNSVITIGESAFYGCRGLTSLPITNSVTSIGDCAFCRCFGLTSVTLPNSVTLIGAFAFNQCSGLETVTISKSVTSIGDGAFSNCPSLKSINVDSENKNYLSIDGILYNKSATTLLVCPEKKETVSIPVWVTSIERMAFADCAHLTSIKIPSSVKPIGDNAFAFCESLRSVTLLVVQASNQ